MLSLAKESLKPGLYTNLSSVTYHRDRALSRSGLLQIQYSPRKFWKNSWMNQDWQPATPSKEMAYGSAIDCLLFERPKFFKRYYINKIDVRNNKKIGIDKKDYDAMIASVKVLQEGEETSLYLRGGMPHVVIVFELNGIMFRCEHDYFGILNTMDYKSAYSLADHHIKDAFWRYGYDMQQALYSISRTRFREQFIAREAEVYGDIDPSFFNAFMESPMDKFGLIFQLKTDPFPYRLIFPQGDTEDNGLRRIEDSVEKYNYYLQKFGTKPWPICKGASEEWSMFYGSKEQ